MGIAAKQCGDLDTSIDALKSALNKATLNNENSIETDMCARILQNMGQYGYL